MNLYLKEIISVNQSMPEWRITSLLAKWFWVRCVTRVTEVLTLPFPHISQILCILLMLNVTQRLDQLGFRNSLLNYTSMFSEYLYALCQISVIIFPRSVYNHKFNLCNNYNPFFKESSKRNTENSRHSIYFPDSSKQDGFVFFSILD